MNAYRQQKESLDRRSSTAQSGPNPTHQQLQAVVATQEPDAHENQPAAILEQSHKEGRVQEEPHAHQDTESRVAWHYGGCFCHISLQKIGKVWKNCGFLSGGTSGGCRSPV